MSGQNQTTFQDRALAVVREWKHYWMSREPGYLNRAMGVDANMAHHLASKVAKLIEAVEREALEQAKTDHENWCPHFHVEYQDQRAALKSARVHAGVLDTWLHAYREFSKTHIKVAKIAPVVEALKSALSEESQP